MAINIIKKNPFFNNIILLLILTSSFKIFGYVTLFIIYLPFFISKFKFLFNYLREENIRIKLSIIFLIMMIIYSFIGSFIINDIRIIIFWGSYFTVCALAYLYHNYMLRRDKEYLININQILYNGSILYFIIFLFMNLVSILIYGNAYQIQNYFWVGGSSSLAISSIFLIQLFNRWNIDKLKINSRYSLLIALYTILINLNSSRLGALYLIIFSLFIIASSITKKIVLRGLSITLIILIINYIYPLIITSSYDTITKESRIHILKGKNLDSRIQNNNKNLVKDMQTANSDILSFNNLYKKDRNIKKLNDRYFELYVAGEKFKESKIITKLFGTGWYSSRITINNNRNRIIDEYMGGENSNIKKNKVSHLQGIVALLLDTGIFGVSFLIYLFAITIYDVFKSKIPLINKLFYSTVIMINFLLLFIGFPMVMVSYILMVLPNGILFNNKFLLASK